jgi:xylulose-5-phosphate/fructose-6-phosphate phosphoketolase
MRDKHIEHKQYVHEHGIDMPEVLEWKWLSGEQ